MLQQKVCCCSDLTASGDVAAVQRWGSPHRTHPAQQAHEGWKRPSRLGSSAGTEGETATFTVPLVSDGDVRREAALGSLN